MQSPGFIIAFLLAFSTSAALAGTIPYPNTGTIAPEVPTYASSSNGVEIYFFGSTANDYDYVNVYDAATGYSSGYILNNHTTPLGYEVTVGTTPGEINASDQLVFYMESPEGQFASLASYSLDKTNHAYITNFAGGALNGTDIPAGLFVGMEDENASHADFNYNDDTFVFAGVNAPSVGTGITPEPTSLALFGTGLLPLGQVARRRFRFSS